MDPDRRAAVDALAASVRALTVSVVGTEAGAGELAAVRAGLDALTARLAAVPRPAGQRPSADRTPDGGQVPTGEAAFDPVTGAGSPVSPPLRVTRADHAATGTTRLTAVHEGAPGAAHGGVLAALMETMTGQAVITADRVRLVTRLQLRYRGPVPLHRELVLASRAGQAEPTRWQVSGTLATADDPDTVLVESTGTVLELRPDQLARHAAVTAGDTVRR